MRSTANPSILHDGIIPDMISYGGVCNQGMMTSLLFAISVIFTDGVFPGWEGGLGGGGGSLYVRRCINELYRIPSPETDPGSTLARISFTLCGGGFPVLINLTDASVWAGLVLPELGSSVVI